MNLYKSIISISIILVLINFKIQSQSEQFAVINNPGILQAKSESLSKLIGEINNQSAISKIFLTDNLTDSGKDQEFNILGNSVERLNIPYYLVGGWNDFYLSDGKGSEIHQIAGQIGFYESDNNAVLIGIPSYVNSSNEIGYIEQNYLNEISDFIKENKFEYVYLFTGSLSLKQITNSDKLLSHFENKKIISVVTSKTNQLNIDSSLVDISIINLPNSLNSNSINYFVFNHTNDSIFIKSKSVLDNKINSAVALSKKQLKRFRIIEDSLKRVNQNKIDTVWYKDYKSTLSTELLVDANKIIVTHKSGLVNGLNPNGSEKWVNNIFGFILNSPDIYKDIIAATTIGGDFYTINSNNGDVLQVIGLGDKITSDASIFELMIDKNPVVSVAVGTSEGIIYAFDLFTNESLWNKKISEHSLINNFVFSNKNLIVQDQLGNIFCVNANSGALIWKFKSPRKNKLTNNSNLLSNENSIVALTDDNVITSINLLSGLKNWDAKITGNLIGYDLFANDTTLVTIAEGGNVTFYSTENGKPFEQFNLEREKLFSAVFLDNGFGILIGLSDGSIISIDKNYVLQDLFVFSNSPINSLSSYNSGILVSNKDGEIILIKPTVLNEGNNIE